MEQETDPNRTLQSISSLQYNHAQIVQMIEANDKLIHELQESTANKNVATSGTFPRSLEETKKERPRPTKLKQSSSEDAEQSSRHLKRSQSRRTARKLGLVMDTEEERQLISSLMEENDRLRSQLNDSSPAAVAFHIPFEPPTVTTVPQTTEEIKLTPTVQETKDESSISPDSGSPSTSRPRTASQVDRDRAGTFRFLSKDAARTRFNVSSSDNVELVVEVEGEKDLIIGGTVDKLTECLTYNRLQSGKVGVGTAFIEEFLFTYNYFTESRYVMVKLQTVYTTSPKEIQLRVINVLKKWAEYHFYDIYSDPELLGLLINFTINVVGNSEHASWVRHILESMHHNLAEITLDGESPISTLKQHKELLNALVLKVLLRKNGLVKDRKKGLNKYKNSIVGSEVLDWLTLNLGLGRQEALNMCQQMLTDTFKDDVVFFSIEEEVVRPKSLIKLPPVISSFMDIPVLLLAQYLTLLDYRIFRTIPTIQLTSQAWMKGKAPTIAKFIDRFNEVSFWVATEIVMCSNIKQRVTVLKRWIQLAEQLMLINNYHTLMAVLSGLNHGCISRLKLTWAALPKQSVTSFEEMCNVMQASQNYKNYRQLLANPKFPFLPYFAIYLRDLTFIEDGNQDYLEPRVINFQKMRMLAKIFGDMQRFQQQKYEFAESDEVFKFLTDPIFVMRGDKELYKYSIICEPSTRRLSTVDSADGSPKITRSVSTLSTRNLSIQ